uniref:NAC transcription factor n=1 Tax=Nicotiana tabacum TaxID=4097 RepID=B3VK71_TOBAC|nr:NAC transcription factor [Nicotiana tabacum]
MGCSSRCPMGNRFHPTDREVLKYLIGFVRDEPLPCQNELMQQTDLYADKEPWQIFEAYDDHGTNKTRYFITPQKKEKPTWKSVPRTVEKGAWKPQSKGLEVFDDKGRLMGFVKSLKYIPLNKSPNNVNGEWLMTEYSLYDRYLGAREIKNKGFVVCKIKKKENPDDKKKGKTVVNNEIIRDVEEFINSALQEDNYGMWNDILVAMDDDQKNIEYIEGDELGDQLLALLGSEVNAEYIEWDEVEDDQLANLLDSADDIDLDAIEFI